MRQHVQISLEGVNEDHLAILGDLTPGFLASKSPNLPSSPIYSSSLHQILVFLDCSTLLHFIYASLIGPQFHILITAMYQSESQSKIMAQENMEDEEEIDAVRRPHSVYRKSTFPIQQVIGSVGLSINPLQPCRPCMHNMIYPIPIWGYFVVIKLASLFLPHAVMPASSFPKSSA